MTSPLAGIELRLLRTKLNLTIGDVANALGRTEDDVVEWEEGRNIPDEYSSYLECLDEAIDTRIDDQLSGLYADNLLRKGGTYTIQLHCSNDSEYHKQKPWPLLPSYDAYLGWCARLKYAIELHGTTVQIEFVR